MIVFYLQLHAKATIAELSRYLEVSRRTICRDIEMLQTAGVDILSCKGKAGGYMLSDGFSFEKILFNQSELSTMLLSTQLLSQFSDTEFAKEAAALNSKISRLLDMKKTEPQIDQFIFIDTENNDQPNNLREILRCIEKAYLSQTMIHVDYQHPFCNRLSTSNLVAPYGLVGKSGAWYLIGFCTEHNRYRIFQTQFIRQCHLCEKAFEKDDTFNADEFWQLKSHSIF